MTRRRRLTDAELSAYHEQGYVLVEDVFEAVDLSRQIYVPMKAGAVLLFGALLRHASDGNQTDLRRRAFIVSSQEATVAKGNGAQWRILRPGNSTPCWAPAS